MFAVEVFYLQNSAAGYLLKVRRSLVLVIIVHTRAIVEARKTARRYAVGQINALFALNVWSTLIVGNRGIVAETSETSNVIVATRVSGKFVKKIHTVEYTSAVGLNVVSNVVLGVAQLIRNARLDNTAASSPINSGINAHQNAMKSLVF